MNGQPTQKRCPQCQTVVDILTQQCPGCGHWFRTQFQQQPINQTTVIPPMGGQHYQAPPNQGFQGQGHQPPPTYGGYGPPPWQCVQKRPGSQSIAIVVVLALLCVWGAPQLYNGQVMKALALFFAGLLACILTGCLAWPIFFIIGLVDGISICNKINQGQPVGLWEFF